MKPCRHSDSLHALVPSATDISHRASQERRNDAPLAFQGDEAMMAAHAEALMGKAFAEATLSMIRLPELP